MEPPIERDKQTEWRRLCARYVGHALFGAGKVDEAIDWFIRLVGTDPDDDLALSDLGVAYFHNGSFYRARVCFLAVLNHAPDQPDAAENLAAAEAKLRPAETFLSASRDFRDQGEWSLALEMAQRAATVVPDHRAALFLKAECLFALGRASEAQHALRHLLGLFAEYPPGRQLLHEIESSLATTGTEPTLPS